jgi:predicted transcriptional regulator of viral defense system
MSPERTLLDGLLAPERCGGFDNVLGAWVRARDTLDLDRLVEYVERLDVGVVRQRAGFLLEELDLSHPALARWQARARRGGSSKLLGSAPYAPTYSERWSLSLNAPLTALRAAAA